MRSGGGGGGDGWTLRTLVDTVDQSLVGQLDTVDQSLVGSELGWYGLSEIE